MVEYKYNKKSGVYIMFNYDTIIKQLEAMSPIHQDEFAQKLIEKNSGCLLYTSPSPRDLSTSRMPSSA